MDIRIDSLLEGARRASGAIVVIDVFRAFTTAAVAFAQGAARIVMVGTVEEALSLRASGVGQICMGEVGGRAPAGFDFGNSPFEVSQAVFNGETIIQRTGAGTQGIIAVPTADRIYAGSLVTANATAAALRSASVPRVTLVAMGENTIVRTDEDEACAIHLRNLLEGRPGDPESVRQTILGGRSLAELFQTSHAYMHPGDIEIALDIGRYDFAIAVTMENGLAVARPEVPR